MHDQVDDWFTEHPFVDRTFGYFALIEGCIQRPTDYYMKKSCWCEMNLISKTRQMTLCLMVSNLDIADRSYNFTLCEEYGSEKKLLLTGEIDEKRIRNNLDPYPGKIQYMEPLTMELSNMFTNLVRYMVRDYLMPQRLWEQCREKTKMVFYYGIDRCMAAQIEQSSNTLFENLVIATQGIPRH